MSAAPVDTSEVSILNRILRPEAATFSPAAARDILRLDFDPVDKDRMRELSEKARKGMLTAAEDVEAGKYETVGHLLGILQSRARLALKSRHGADETSPETR